MAAVAFLGLLQIIEAQVYTFTGDGMPDNWSANEIDE